jgi:crossover junction endodeoxyribonuclease RusA
MKELDHIQFFVAGHAKSSGSKRAFVNPKTGKMIVTAANPKQKQWQEAVKWMAMQIWERRIPWDGPIALELAFIRPRPKAHFGTGNKGATLKDFAATAQPTTKPDSLKLARAVEDALSGIIYIDDSQIVRHEISKVFGDKPGVAIIVRKFKTPI